VKPDVVVRPRGALDLDEARRLVGAFEAMPGLRIHVDVSAAREVHPAGLAFLAYALDGDGRVTLGGLTRRHERLIAYLLGEQQARVAGATSTSPATPTP
jgi:hypothetical protein